MVKKIFLMICLFLLCSCAINSQKGIEPATDAGTFSSFQDDEAGIMFYEALIATSPEGESTGMNETRDILIKITQLYSHTRWHKPAEFLLMIIDHEQSCVAQQYENQNRCDLVFMEKSQCDQYKSELTRVLMENEQLKKDLQEIKKLEIELGQKNRMK